MVWRGMGRVARLSPDTCRGSVGRFSAGPALCGLLVSPGAAAFVVLAFVVHAFVVLAFVGQLDVPLVGFHVFLVEVVRFLQVLLELLFGVPAAAGHLTHLTGGFGSGRGHVGP